jgi:hypothetical protein
MTSDLDVTYFRDPEDPELAAFWQVMFAHARFEARFREIQGVITEDPKFGEQWENRWMAHDDAAQRVTNLIRNKLGRIPETEQIASCVEKAVGLSRERHLLAHGEWWLFDRKKQMVGIRSGKGKHADRSITDIRLTTQQLLDVEVELSKLQSSIASRWLPEEY